MRASESVVYSAELLEDAPPETGLFTWDLSENTLHADGALASIFGLDAGEASGGLPIEEYLERVHPEDRPGLAKTIRDSIIADRPQQKTYRVMDGSGHYQFVTGYGRGFRNRSGEILQYVGIVVPAFKAMSIPRTSH